MKLKMKLTTLIAAACAASLILTACGSPSFAGNTASSGETQSQTSTQDQLSTQTSTDTPTDSSTDPSAETVLHSELKKQAVPETEEAKQNETAKRHIEIVIKDYGTVKAELDPQYAPISVANFIKLAESGFYDGLTFHRIIDGFMIQGGDPEGTGMGGSDETIKGEFENNGVDNPLSHTRGAVSMARSMSNDSASSQFFIVQSDSTYLDGDYAAFGYVTEGMDIVDKICKDTPVTDRNGAVKAENRPVIEKIVVVD